jgi:hypothetical protein
VVQQPITPIIIEVAEAATEEISVSDVLVGVFSFTGVMIVVAVVAAALFAFALIALRRLRPGNPLNGDVSSQTRLGLHIQAP